MPGHTGPRPPIIAAGSCHTRRRPAPSGHPANTPCECWPGLAGHQVGQLYEAERGANYAAMAAREARGDRGAAPSGLATTASGGQCVRAAGVSGGVPGRPGAAAAGTSGLPHACCAGVPATAGRSRPRARRPRGRSCPRPPPARGATAAGGARARLLATRSRSPLPTIPRSGWHRLPLRAASALATAAPADPATPAGWQVPGGGRYCLA
jgi:hypothetical protein